MTILVDIMSEQIYGNSGVFQQAKEEKNTNQMDNSEIQDENGRRHYSLHVYDNINKDSTCQWFRK